MRPQMRLPPVPTLNKLALQIPLQANSELYRRNPWTGKITVIFQLPAHITKPYLNRQRQRENNGDTAPARVCWDLMLMLTALTFVNTPSNHLRQSERYHLNCDRIKNDLLMWLQAYHRRIVGPKPAITYLKMF